jgi:hypothetical protein
VIAVELLVFLAPRQPHASGVDNDDVVAGIDMGRINGLVLALQQPRRFGGDPA